MALCRIDKEQPHRVPDVDILYVQRFGSGDYRRPGRNYRTTICREHAQSLLRATTAGHWKVDGYSIRTLERATGLRRQDRYG